MIKFAIFLGIMLLCITNVFSQVLGLTLDQHNTMYEALREAKGHECDIVFLGASNVARLTSVGKPVWDEYYVPRHAVDLGVSGDTAEQTLQRLLNYDLEGLKPKAVVLFVGLNDHQEPPVVAAADIMADAHTAEYVFPKARVLLVNLSPNLRDNLFSIATNKLLKQYADNQDIYYVDIYDQFKPKGLSWDGVGKDGLHFDAYGYQIWAETMEPTLDKILNQNKPQK